MESRLRSERFPPQAGLELRTVRSVDQRLICCAIELLAKIRLLLGFRDRERERERETERDREIFCR